ncbi:MAG: glutaredoxin family protein [Caldimonas sp.]
MSLRARPSPTGPLPRAAIAIALVLAATCAQAQYKVIGPDGKVTYTDREPSASEGRIIPLGNRAVAPSAEPQLPFELRQPASQYPVTLYVTSSACDPCTSARQSLLKRGIPFAERLVVTAEDSEALERLSGAREAPTLTIGAQTLRGYAAEVWTSYLDAAGYPRESRLPTSYQYRPATPIVDRRESTTARSEPRVDAGPAPVAPTAPVPGGIRF